MQLRSLCVQVRGGFHVASNLFRTHQNASITATCGLKNEKFPVSRLYSSVQNSTVAQSKSLDGGGSGNAYSMCRRDFFGYFMVCLGENRELFTPRALACSTVPGKFTVFVDRINLFSLCYPMEWEILNKAGAKLFLRDSADNNSQGSAWSQPRLPRRARCQEALLSYVRGRVKGLEVVPRSMTMNINSLPPVVKSSSSTRSLLIITSFTS